MVKGLEIFRRFFKDFNGQFTLIGGTACDIIMENLGVAFRATKDLDIVLIVEVLEASFVDVFWQFVQDGDYAVQQKESGEKQFYRFMQPGNDEYPSMLELFSRIPDALGTGSHNGRLTPVPVDESVSSLSAILIDPPYYEFLHEGIKIIDDLPVVGAEHLIPLKAKAWLDLNERINTDSKIGRRNVRKHKNDVFRLSQVIDPELNLCVPQIVKDDFSLFLDKTSKEPDNLKSLKINSMNLKTLVSYLRGYYVGD